MSFGHHGRCTLRFVIFQFRTCPHQNKDYYLRFYLFFESYFTVLSICEWSFLKIVTVS